ncbi:MAG: hypothetical protein HY899_03955 [Deltaproteobacteria bacterium]|nr:hypothetical protein [Deltaproteobacteria bacterium]
MRIASVAHAVPSRHVTTDMIAARLRIANQSHLSPQDLDRLESRLRRYLERAGSDGKFWVDDGERAVDLLRGAGQAALNSAGLSAIDIDLIVYVGVGRPWLEPAMANLVQAELGAARATGFDVLDGCLGWLRGVQLVRSMFASAGYRRALVVSCECGLDVFGRWQFETVEAIEPYLATFTIGEAATATVLTDEAPADDFYFRFANYGEQTHLCMIPLPHADQYASRDMLAALATGKFYARSEELLRFSIERIVEIFEGDARLHSQQYDLLVGHAASERASQLARERLGLPERIYFPTHAAYGNTVASSLPLGLSLAIQQGRLRRGDKVIIVGGASGISVGVASFTF